jgi:hypothetical protein
MKNVVFAVLTLVSAGAFATASVVEGEIVKIVPAETEIYVKSKEDGKKYEYYFNKATQVFEGEKASTFANLKTGQKVRVTAQKKGKRLDPEKVEILQ